MGFIRGLGKFFGSILFTTFLVLAILLMELADFTGYDNFKLIASGILKEQLFSAISEQDLSGLRSFLLSQCSRTDKVNVPIFGGQVVIVECNDVKNSNESQLPALITTALVDSLYYKDFDCSFVECVRSGNPQNLLIVLSNEGNHFYKNLQIYMWIGTGVGLALLLVSIGTWAGRLKGVGFNLVFTGLPFLLLGHISSFMPALPPEIESSVKPVIDNLTSSLKDKFIIVLVIGVILLVIGYALGFYLSRKSKK